MTAKYQAPHLGELWPICAGRHPGSENLHLFNASLCIASNTKFNSPLTNQRKSYFNTLLEYLLGIQLNKQLCYQRCIRLLTIYLFRNMSSSLQINLSIIHCLNKLYTVRLHSILGITNDVYFLNLQFTDPPKTE